MDTHHPGDSGFWILGVGRMSRVEGPSDSGFWILDTGSEVPGGKAVGLWILDSGNWGPSCAREGRCRLDSGFLDSGYWAVGGPGREGCRTLDSGFWKLGAVVCSGGSVPPGFWILGFWILQSATRHGLDSGFLDSGNCQNPESRCADSGSWILDSGFCPTRVCTHA